MNFLLLAGIESNVHRFFTCNTSTVAILMLINKLLNQYKQTNYNTQTYNTQTNKWLSKVN